MKQSTRKNQGNEWKQRLKQIKNKLEKISSDPYFQDLIYYNNVYILLLIDYLLRGFGQSHFGINLSYIIVRMLANKISVLNLLAEEITGWQRVEKNDE